METQELKRAFTSWNVLQKAKGCPEAEALAFEICGRLANRLASFFLHEPIDLENDLLPILETHPHKKKILAWLEDKGFIEPTDLWSELRIEKNSGNKYVLSDAKARKWLAIFKNTGEIEISEHFAHLIWDSPVNRRYLARTSFEKEASRRKKRRI
jgi:hypothetical protein